MTPNHFRVPNIPHLSQKSIKKSEGLLALPHVSDAWIAEDSTKVGYEISFNKYFYVHQPLRDLTEVIAEIRDLEKETEGLLEEILTF